MALTEEQKAAITAAKDAEKLWIIACGKIMRMTKEEMQQGKHRELLMAAMMGTVKRVENPNHVCNVLLLAMENIMEMFTSVLQELGQAKVVNPVRVAQSFTDAFLASQAAPKGANDDN